MEETPLYENLTYNLDGSYTFVKNGLPYNCPNTGEWESEFAEVDAWAKEHPNKVQHEQPVVQTFDDLKALKFAELENSYDEHVSGSFTTTQGYLMQFDTSDSIKMQGAITLMESVGAKTGYITQANDVTIYNIPLETMKAVLVEMLNAYAQCHARKQELRSFINNAQTKEELDEILISWPI